MASSKDEFLSNLVKRGKGWENMISNRVGKMGKIPSGMSAEDTARVVLGRGRRRIVMGGGGALGLNIYRHSSARRGLRGRSSGAGPMYQ